MTARIRDLAGKAWRYGLAALEQPQYLPSVLWQVVVHGVHLGELLKLNRYRRWFAQAGLGTVLDVGANTGQFASAVRAVLPSVQLYSFEPLPDCCARLRRRLERFGRFAAYNVALGDVAGVKTFQRNVFTEASSLLKMGRAHEEAFPWARDVKTETVRVDTLDACASSLTLAPRVLLKLDVQGYELKVLQGARQTLAAITYVLVETSYQSLYEGEATFDDVYQFLKEAGFDYAGNLDQLLSPLDGSILQADLLFVRPR